MSLASIAVIAACLALAWSKRFLALGALTIANLVVFVFTVLAPRVPCDISGAQSRISAVHCDLALHGADVGALEPLAFLQLFTAMFVHSGFFHLFGNLLVLIIFSLPFEERIGPRAFLVTYLLSGLIGTLVFLGPTWGDRTLLMGASGAVFGIIGAFAGTYPRLVVPLPLPLLFIMIFVRMQVWVAAALFAGLQFLLQVLSEFNPLDNTAYMAHLGGLAGGLVIAAAWLHPRARQQGAPRKPVPLGHLEPFARDAPARDALEHMQQNRDLPDVFRAWQEQFLRHARCPTCGQSTTASGSGVLVCTRGHRFDLRKGRVGEGAEG